MEQTLIFIGIIAATAAAVVLIRSKLTVEARAKLDYFMKLFIAAAETEINGEKVGAKRKAWVLEQLRGLKLVNDKNEAFVSSLIDGMCRVLTADNVINTSLGVIVDAVAGETGR